MSDKNKYINHFEGKKWIYEGVGFGIIMYILNVFIFPYFFYKSEISLNESLIALPIWIIGGLGYGLTMRTYFRRRKKKDL